VHDLVAIRARLPQALRDDRVRFLVPFLVVAAVKEQQRIHRAQPRLALQHAFQAPPEDLRICRLAVGARPAYHGGVRAVTRLAEAVAGQFRAVRAPPEDVARLDGVRAAPDEPPADAEALQDLRQLGVVPKDVADKAGV